MHRELFCAEYAPDRQYSHVSIVEFTCTDAFPKAQSVHASAPGLTLYFPAAHAVQSPSVPDQPALHEQFASAIPPATELEFAGHEMHSDLSLVEYVPALQEQSVIAVPPVPEMEFAGHEMHSDLSFVKYVSAAQVQPRSTSPFDPGLQIQLVMSVLLTGDEESGGQSKHTIAFAGQSIHEMGCPYWLARHPQLVEGINVHQLAVKPKSTKISFDVNTTCKKG